MKLGRDKYKRIITQHPTTQKPLYAPTSFSKDNEK